MNSSTEIRKLPPSSLQELVQILEYNDSWKILMDKIPKLLEKDNYECRLSLSNFRKYRSEHFKLIENASKTTGRACTEILFDEWGTSGRVRPALGHLLFLLTSVELFRAADFVAVDLLNKNAPSRPSEGPPAPVIIPNMPDRKLEEIEKILNEIDYPSSVISMINSNSHDVNVNQSSSSNQNIIPPKIIISEVRESNVVGNIPLVIHNASHNRQNHLTRQNATVVEHSVADSDMIAFSQTAAETEQNSISDMMQFSETLSGDNHDIPCISELIHSNSNNPSDTSETLSRSNNNQCTTSEMYSNSDQSATSETLSNSNIPNLSALNVSVKSESLPNEDNVPAISELLPDVSTPNTTSQQVSIPNLSILNADQSLPQLSTLMPTQSLVPQLDVLLSDPSKQNFTSNSYLPVIGIATDSSSEISTVSSTFSHNSNVSHGSQRTCASPLPNLSLNTLLPHFTYTEIEVATNNFDVTPYTNSEHVGNGRFLGSGAFGSVFLALNIGNKSVAVKKLFLNNADVVNVDDPVTKQFRNEVEILSKYKHENLLSILGYSCDGPTYCLLYEFMPGGALKDRLQSKEQKLIWTDRMYIALGTARAVAYLHTAYLTPLIHRDIKSANILLDCNNKPRLCDFGLVRLLTNPNTNTSTTAFGTSAYMAREAFRGDVSVKVDTFSFGVVLLELITGLPPLDETREGLDIVTHVEEVCEDHSGIFSLIDTKAGSWVAKNKNFAEELYQISTKCLEENKKKRPTMVDISESLAELIKESA